MSTFEVRMPDQMGALVVAQAERAGLTTNEYLLSIIALQIGARAEAEQIFAQRAARASGRLEDILANAGAGNPPEPGDEIPPELAERVKALTGTDDRP